MAAETLGSLHYTLDPQSLLLSHFSDPLNHNNDLKIITDSYYMERGSRYEAYAQLRESKLVSKRLKLDEDHPLLEIPTSEIPLPEKKSVKFKGSFERISEDERVIETPKKSEVSGFSPLVRKSVRFQGVGMKCENVLEVPKCEYSPPVRKSVRIQVNGGPKKQGSSVLAQSVPDFSAALRKENRRPGAEFGSNVSRIPRYEKSATPPPPSMLKREKMYGSLVKGSKSVNSGEKQSGGGPGRVLMGRKSYANMEELKGLSIAAANAISGENKGIRKSNVLRKSTVFSSTIKYY